jgi:hypothetical protein
LKNNIKPLCFFINSYFGLILAVIVPNITILYIKKAKKMDIASLIGLIGTLGMIAGAMVSSGGIGAFIDTPSMLIVIGGTFFAVMYRSTLPMFLASFGAMVKVFMPGAKKT